MILYFSGTGNSAYLAKKLAKETGEVLFSLNDALKYGADPQLTEVDRLIFVTPTYSWRLPRVVAAWIRRVDFPSGLPVWFVMNCGSEIGNADRYNRRLCAEKGLQYRGTAEIQMPENYIALFSVPGETEARAIIARAEPVLEEIAQSLEKEHPFPPRRIRLLDRLYSRLVNPIFYTLFVKARAFRVDARCIGCGKCETRCPLNNVHLVDGKPVWGNTCTHCMACICGCPTRAIEYGKKTVGKPRYWCTGENDFREV